MARERRKTPAPGPRPRRAEKAGESARSQTIQALRDRLQTLLEATTYNWQGRARVLTKGELGLASAAEADLRQAERALATGDPEEAVAGVSRATDRIHALEGLPDVRMASQLEVERLTSAQQGAARRQTARDGRIREAVAARVTAGQKVIAACAEVAEAEGLSTRSVERIFYSR